MTLVLVILIPLIHYSATSFSLYFSEFCFSLLPDVLLLFACLLKICSSLILYSSYFSCLYPEGVSEMEVLQPVIYLRCFDFWSHFCNLSQKHRVLYNKNISIGNLSTEHYMSSDIISHSL